MTATPTSRRCVLRHPPLLAGWQQLRMVRLCASTGRRLIDSVAICGRQPYVYALYADGGFDAYFRANFAALVMSRLCQFKLHELARRSVTCAPKLIMATA